MRLLKPKPRFVYKQGVEIEVLAHPNILIVYMSTGEVWFPHDVYRRFRNVEQIVQLAAPFVERQNAAAD